MPGIVAHLTIANRILAEHPQLVCNLHAFYLGSVAPDTIESKAGCSRNDKKQVHLREGIRDIEWLSSQNMLLFKNRIRRFADEYIADSVGSQRDFNIGYLVHLLTDEWSHRTIRQTIRQKANEMNVLEVDREFFCMMATDLEAMDNYLLNSNEEIATILDWILKQEITYDLAGFIEKEYIEGSIQWWRNSYLAAIKQKTLKYLSETDISNFVDIAVQEILGEIMSLL